MAETSMPWIKLYTDLLDDRKLGRLPNDAVRYRFVQLLLIAGECDADGCLMDGSGVMTVEDIAWRLRVDKEQLLEELQQLADIGLISLDDIITIVNFSKRQGRPQSVKREQWREAAKRHRSVIDDTSESNTPREEKRREEERREEEESPPLQFNELSSAFSTASGIMAYDLPKWIKALEQLEKKGATPEDIKTTVDELRKREYTILGPWSIENAIVNAIGKRKSNGRMSIQEQGYRGPND